MEDIEWRPILDTTYSVSNTGLVKNKNGMIMKPEIMKKGYLRIDLGKKGKVMIHRLVGHAFIENPNNYPQINHIWGQRE